MPCMSAWGRCRLTLRVQSSGHWRLRLLPLATCRYCGLEAWSKARLRKCTSNSGLLAAARRSGCETALRQSATTWTACRLTAEVRQRSMSAVATSPPTAHKDCPTQPLLAEPRRPHQQPQKRTTATDKMLRSVQFHRTLSFREFGNCSTTWVPAY